MSERRIRVLIAKPGLDGHDRGAKIVARALRDAGFEVIYTGLHRLPEDVAEAAVQEDVDVIGVSILSGAHMALIPPLLEALAARSAGDIKVLVGGVIPAADRQKLRALGTAEVFDQDATTGEIIAWIRREVEASGQAESNNGRARGDGGRARDDAANDGSR